MTHAALSLHSLGNRIQMKVWCWPYALQQPFGMHTLRSVLSGICYGCVALLEHFQVLGLGFRFSMVFLVPDFGRTLHCASNFAASWHVTFSVHYWKELKVHKSIRWHWLDVTNNINNLLIFCISFWDYISAVECSICITTMEGSLLNTLLLLP